MTCLNPKPVKFHFGYIINKKGNKVPTKHMRFINEYMALTDHTTDYIPCGKCAGCRIDKANDWATRAYLESQNHTLNAFVTLTYDNEHLPKPKSLIKADLQKFWKRLRKSIQPQKISYLACGEYGLQTRRPHYHCAIFNYWPKDAIQFQKNENGDTLYISNELQKIWGKGFVIIGRLTYQSAAYIARYVFKKAYGDNVLSLKKHQTPEFITSSKRPAIAKNFYTDFENWRKIVRNGGIFIPTTNGIKIKPIPRYLLNKWKEEFPFEYYLYQDIQHDQTIKNWEETLQKTDKKYHSLINDLNKAKEEKLKRLDKFRKDL